MSTCMPMYMYFYAYNVKEIDGACRRLRSVDVKSAPFRELLEEWSDIQSSRRSEPDISGLGHGLRRTAMRLRERFSWWLPDPASTSADLYEVMSQKMPLTASP